MYDEKYGCPVAWGFFSLISDIGEQAAGMLVDGALRCRTKPIDVRIVSPSKDPGIVDYVGK